jgi:hypothetical protein
MLKINFPEAVIRKFAMGSVLVTMLAGCGGGGGGGTDPRDTSGGTGGTGGTGTAVAIAIGNGTGDAFVRSVAASSVTGDIEIGGSTTISINIVDTNSSNSASLEDYEVSFTSDCVTNGFSTFDADSLISLNGLAEVVYTTSGCREDTVTASITVDGTVQSANVALTFEGDDVATGFEFVSADPSQLSLKGMGSNEVGTFTFRLVGALAAPIGDAEVSFRIVGSAGGVALVDGWDTGTTDSSGLVSTKVQSGTVPTVIEVIADYTTPSTAETVSGSSGDITVSTGVAVENRFTLFVQDTCNGNLSGYNPNAWSLAGTEVCFGVIVSDYFGNSVPDGTQVSFVSPEGGVIDSSCELINSECGDVVWRSAAASGSEDDRITVMAFMTGAEDFDDNNGNGYYDANDSFSLFSQDLAEAYADENEDGVYGMPEYFWDHNEDLVRNENDGQWNGPCLNLPDAAVQPVCAPEGERSVTISDTAVLSLSDWNAFILSIGTFTPAGLTFDSTSGIVSFGGMDIGDVNGNSLPVGTTFKFTIESVVNTIDIVGSDGFTVANSPDASENISVRLSTTDDDATGLLTLTISVPGQADQTIDWNVTAT